MLKALFALFVRYLHFYPAFLAVLKNSFIRRLWLISKFMTSQTEQKIKYNIHFAQNLKN